MSFFKKDKLSIERQDPNEIARQAGSAATSLAKTQGQLFQSGVSDAVTAASSAAQSAFDLNSRLAPQIREQQMASNPELFSAMARQDGLSSGGMLSKLQADAESRIGTGLTADEERALRESSRSSFTSRGLFRSNPALLDEIVRRQRGDTSARMQNNEFARSILGTSSDLNQRSIQNRQSLFIDPRNAAGISAGDIFSTGGSMAQRALDSGVGISSAADAANQQAAAAEAEANRGGGLGMDLLKGGMKLGAAYLTSGASARA